MSLQTEWLWLPLSLNANRESQQACLSASKIGMLHNKELGFCPVFLPWNFHNPWNDVSDRNAFFIHELCYS